MAADQSSKRLLGEKKCIGGKVYQYYPATPENSQQAPEQQTELTKALLDMANSMISMSQYVIAELSYSGVYRNLAYPIPGNSVNYLIPLPFPVRSFRLETNATLILRLQDSQNDAINLSNTNSPFVLNSIPAGLSFSEVYITNQNSNEITINIFAMG